MCKNIAASYLKVGDKTISTIRFQTTANDKLPQLYCIYRKLEPLVTELNNVTYYFSGELFFIEIKKGKEGISEEEEKVPSGAWVKKNIYK